VSTSKGNPRGTGEWKKLRQRVLARDGHTCFYCGDPEANQVDHVVSMKDEPSLALDINNLVTACRRCNLAKGSKSQALFFKAQATPPVLSTSFSPTTIGRVIPGPMTASSDLIDHA
jgi:5-methylcytosine-specific restriction endonuclease McrA